MNETEKILKTASLLGRRILESGGEIYRVEDSMKRFLTAYGIEKPQIFAIPATIITTVCDGDGKSYTVTERIESVSLNMDRLDKFNALCRLACLEKPDIQTVNKEIEKINRSEMFGSKRLILAYGIASRFFCLFWGGTFKDFIPAFIAGMLTKLVLDFMNKAEANLFFSNVCGARVIAAVAIISYLSGLAGNMDMIIIGSIMTLVPGVAITNIMRDIIRGDVITGTTKIAEVLLTATAIAIGTGIPIALVRALTGGIV